MMAYRYEETPYRTVWQALRLAFAWEALSAGSPGVERQARDHDALSMLDRVAEGAMLRRCAFDAVGVRGKGVLRCAYGMPDPPDLGAKKAEAVMLCARFVIGDRRDEQRDLQVVRDAVAHWAGLPPVATPDAHASRLGVSVPTVYAWTRSKDPARRSAVFLMETWLGDACQRVEREFQRRGVVP